MTGGTIIAVLSLWALTGQKALSQQVNWMIVGITLILAAFLSWREEWIKTGGGLFDIDFSEVNSAVDKYTNTQARQFLDRYVGKRTQITATIDDFHYIGFVPWTSLLFLRSGRVMTTTTFFRWNPNLSGLAMLPKGTEVTITGRIKSIDRNSLSLADCRVITFGQKSDQANISPIDQM